MVSEIRETVSDTVRLRNFQDALKETPEVEPEEQDKFNIESWEKKNSFWKLLFFHLPEENSPRLFTNLRGRNMFEFL